MKRDVVLFEGSMVALVVMLFIFGLAVVLMGAPAGLADHGTVIEKAGKQEAPPASPRVHVPPGQLKKAVRFVRVATFTPAMATRYGFRYREGVLVTEIVSVDAPVTVLLERLDVIVTVNGEPVGNVDQLKKRLKKYRSSDWVEIIVVRKGALLTVTIPVAAFDL